MKTTTFNATITSVSLSIADHGALVGWLTLKDATGEQCFGGFSLFVEDEDYRFRSRMNFRNYTGLWIVRCCEVVGTHTWEGLVGKNCRVYRDDRNTIRGIGHIIEDKTFWPGVEFKAFEEMDPPK